MLNILLKPGDVFAVDKPAHKSLELLSILTNIVQKIWSKDDKSEYVHSGIILNSKGKTFESDFRITSHNLFETYTGKLVLIARWKYMSQEKFIQGWDAVKGDGGKLFPVYRFPLYLFPPLAKYIYFNPGVCSELTAKFLYHAGARHKQFAGTNVDDLVDDWKNHRDYEIIYDDIL